MIIEKVFLTVGIEIGKNILNYAETHLLDWGSGKAWNILKREKTSPIIDSLFKMVEMVVQENIGDKRHPLNNTTVLFTQICEIIFKSIVFQGKISDKSYQEIKTLTENYSIPVSDLDSLNDAIIYSIIKDNDILKYCLLNQILCIRSSINEENVLYDSKEITRFSEDNIIKYLQEIRELLVGLISDWQEQKPPYALTMIPIATDLIGREREIQSIYRLLNNNNIVSIFAEGGMGKTAVASRIINEIKAAIVSGASPYKHIAWITSTGEGHLKEDLIKIDIPAVNNTKSIDGKFREAVAFFQNNPSFLVIDNMDELPTCGEEDTLNTISGKTQILITSRVEIRNLRQYPLPELNIDDAVTLFYKYYKKKASEQLSIDLLRTDDDYPYVQEIVSAAFHNALFVELIAKMAYAENWELSELLEKLRQGIFNIDSRHPIPTDHAKRRGEQGNLLVQIQKLYDMSRLTERQKEILSFLTIFPPEHIVFHNVLIWAGFEDDKEDNLLELENRGWIERCDEGYIIHTLIKRSIELQNNKTSFTLNKYRHFINQIGRTDQYLQGNMVYTKIQERIIVLETICKLLEKRRNKTKTAVRLYISLAKVYEHQGFYTNGLHYYTNALIIQKKLLDSQHPDIAATYCGIASIKIEMGDYKEALGLYEEALNIRNQVFGYYHLATAEALRGIADVYRNLYDNDMSLDYYKQAKNIQEAFKEDADLDKARTYNGMALVYRRLGDSNKALTLFKMALDIRKEILGEEHPATAMAYNNIALIYKEQRNYSEMFKNYRKAVDIKMKLLGDKHPSTALTYNSLANAYRDQGNYDKALEYYQSAKLIYEDMLGKEHRATSMLYHDYGVFLLQTDDYSQAREYLENAYNIRQKLLGSTHPETKESKEYLELLRICWDKE